MIKPNTVEYRINPNGMYALYKTLYGWRESASVRNESLDLGSVHLNLGEEHV
jgi:hypothetical protein